MKADHRSKAPLGRLKIGAIAILLLLLFVFVVLALLFPPYEPLIPSGPYAVATTRYTYIDENRIEAFVSSGEKRRVNATVWYPQPVADEEAFPLILFSHGGLGLETSNESLYLELASHGYAVWAIGHPYHALWTSDTEGRRDFVNRDYFLSLQREDAGRNRQQSFDYYQEWMALRTGDINLVLDSILQQARTGADGIYRLVDVGRIGVMGHSLGGAAALAMPRQRNDIAAVIALESPFLYDIVGVANDEFVWIEEAYPTPVLTIYSDSSWDHLHEWPQYARNAAWLLDPPVTERNLYLPGAGHFSLTDLVLVSPQLVRFLEGEAPSRGSIEYLQAVNRACLEFFDQYLK